ncbi:MAG: hypothetical protein IAF94_21305 [Pirellulaceae bacterium]|nr:hypothetical protein [Pirellulaceae bacterium]
MSGRVAAAVEVSPSFVVLPRASEAGPIYLGECVCRSTQGKAFTLSADTPPTGLSVVLGTPAADFSQAVRIEWDPAKDVERPARGFPKVRLRAIVEGKETIIDVGVYCRTQGDS